MTKKEIFNQKKNLKMKNGMENAFTIFKMERFKLMKISEMVKSMANVSVFIKMEIFNQKNSLKMQN